MDYFPQYADFLAEFKRQRRWLLWRDETRDGRQTKVPYSVHGRFGSSTDRRTWASYEEAVAVVDGYDGLGFAVGEGIVLVDIDGCCGAKTGLMEPWAQAIISLLDAPTEVSPSGAGVHIYLKSWNARSLKRMFGTGGGKRGIEIYSDGRYSTITFNHLPGTPHEIPERDLALFIERVDRGDFDPEDVRNRRINESCSRWEREAERRDAKLGTSFVLDSWVAAHNVEVLQRKSDGIIIVACPGSHGGYDARDGRAFLKQFRNGAVAAGCLHQTCSLYNGNGNRWRAFRRLVEGPSACTTPCRPHKTDASPEAAAAPPKFSEDALALRFTRRHMEDLRYVAKWGRWLRYEGTRWQEDAVLEAFDKCRLICREASDECLSEGKEALAKQLTSASTIAAVHRIASADPRTAGTANQWDSSIWLLNTPAGAVDPCHGRNPVGITRGLLHEDDGRRPWRRMPAVAPIPRAHHGPRP